jgi:hypothetical protein
MDALKQNVAELTSKEQDELMLFILESRAGGKKKASKKEKVSDPDAPKREMSEGQKAWTDTIKKVQLVVNRDAPADTSFKYKQAMTVASAIKKAELVADDKTIMTFYLKLKAEGLAATASASESESAAAATAPKKAKKTKVVKDE